MKDVTILGLDTATARLSVALLRGEDVAHEESADPVEGGRPRHATALLAAVQAAVEAAGGWRRVDLIAVGVGPGTFTGLRIGVATARALAQARSLPLAGVSSLQALAVGCGETGGPVLATLDAKRREVFAELRDSSGEVLWPARPIAPVELAGELAPLPEGTRAIGDGAVRFRHEIERAGACIPDDDDPVHQVSATAVCRIGRDLAADEPATVEPNYLRRPDAELWREGQAAR